MADESTLLEYLIRAQDQAKGMLEQQVKLLERLTDAVEKNNKASQRHVQESAKAAAATQRHSAGLTQLFKAHSDLDKSNKAIVAGFQAISAVLSSGSARWTERVNHVKALDAEVRKNAGFLAKYGSEWEAVVAKMSKKGKVAEETIQELNRLGQAFNEFQKIQKKPITLGVDPSVAKNVRETTAAVTQGAQQQKQATESLAQSHQKLVAANRETSKSFSAVITILQSGNASFEQRIAALDRLDAAVRENGQFIREYGGQWTALIAKLREAGPVAQATIDKLKGGAVTFGAVATQQKDPGKAFAVAGAQSTRDAAEAEKKHQAELEKTAAAIRRKGDALQQLLREQQNLIQSNQRVVQGVSAVVQQIQTFGRVTPLAAGGLQVMNAAVQQNQAFMSRFGAQWNRVFAELQAGGPISQRTAKELSRLGQEFREVTKAGGTTERTLQNVNAAATAMSAAVGAGAAFVLHKFGQEFKAAVNEASKFQNTMIGLGTVAKSFGQNVNATTQAAVELASDGLITVTEAGQGLKNLLMTGFGLPEAINLMKGFKDIAAFNRQASLELGYAIVSATEGLKNQNSLLVDNAGLTKNLTIILKEMGLSERDLAKVSSDVNVRTALYNGLLREMAISTGDAQRLTETYSGAMSKFHVQVQLLQVALGERFLPALTVIINKGADFISWLRNSESALAVVTRLLLGFAAVFATVLAAVLALTASVAAAVGAWVALKVALGVISVSLTALLGPAAAVAAGIAAITVAWVALTKSDPSKALDDQNKKLEEQRQKLVAWKAEFEKFQGADLAPVSGKDTKAFQEQLKKLRDEFPTLQVNMKNTETVTRSLDIQVLKINKDLADNAVSLSRAKLASMGFTGTLEEMERQLQKQKEGVKEYGGFWQDVGTILSGIVSGTFNALKAGFIEIWEVTKALVTGVGDLLALLGKLPGVSHAIAFVTNLVNKRRGEMAETAANWRASTEEGNKAAEDEINLLKGRATEATNAANALSGLTDVQNAENAMSTRGNELKKGYILTNADFVKAQEDLAMSFAAALREGASVERAYARIHDKAKELFDATRTGIPIVDGLAETTVRQYNAEQKALRIRQELEARTELYADKARQLGYSIQDQTTGVESNNKVWQLLTSAMAANRLQFDAQLMRIPVLAGMVNDLADRVGLETSKWELLAKARREAYAEQNRIAEGSPKLRQETEAFSQKLFDMTEGVESVGGQWLILQKNMAAAQGAGLSTQQMIALFGPAFDKHLNQLEYGSAEWQRMSDVMRQFNMGPAIQELTKFQESAKVVMGDNTKLLSDGLALYAQHGAVIREAFKATGDASAVSVEFIEENRDAILALEGSAVGLIPAIAALIVRTREWNAAQEQAVFRSEQLTAAMDAAQEVSKGFRLTQIEMPDLQAQFAKIGQSSAIQQVRDAEVAANKQVKVAQDAIDKISQQYNRLIHSRYYETLSEQGKLSYKLQYEAALAYYTQAQTLAKITSDIQIAEALKVPQRIIREWGQKARQIARLWEKAMDPSGEGGQLVTEGEIAEINAQTTAFETQRQQLLKNYEIIADIEEKYRGWTEALRGFGDMTAGLGTLMDQLRPGEGWDEFLQVKDTMAKAGAEVEKFGDKLNDIWAKEKIDLADLLDLASFGMKFAAAIMQGIKQVGQMKQGLAKILAGSEIGGQIGGMVGQGIGFAFGGPAGAAIGKIIGTWGGKLVGGIVAAFHKANWEKIGQEVAERFGKPISEELAKQIDELSKTLEGGTKAQRNQRAELLSINAILEEQGGLLTENFQNFTMQSLGLIEEVQRGGETAGKALEELEGIFGKMVTFMDTNLRGLADSTMLNWIQRMQEAGIEIKGITEFLTKMADQGVKAVGSLVKAFSARFAKPEELTNKIIEMTDKRRDILEKIAKLEKEDKKGAKGAPSEIAKLRMELAQLDKEFEKTKKTAQGVMSLIANAAIDGQDRFDRLGRMVDLSFDMALGSGKPFLATIREMTPTFLELQKAAETGGFAVSESVAKLLNLGQWAEANTEIAEGADALNELAKAVHNSNRMTQSSFSDLISEAMSLRSDMEATGLTGEEAFSIMQPSLQTLWELQRRFNYELSESQQKMLDEAEAAGVVGEKHMSASERMAESLDKVVNRLDLLLQKYGIIPTALDNVESANRDAANSAGGITDAANEAADAYRRLQDAANDASSAAQDANRGIVEGNSPGGINEIILKLKEVNALYPEMGRIAGSASRDITRSAQGVTSELEKQIREFRLGPTGTETSVFEGVAEKAKTQGELTAKAFVDALKWGMNDLTIKDLKLLNPEATQEEAQKMMQDLQTFMEEKRRALEGAQYGDKSRRKDASAWEGASFTGGEMGSADVQKLFDDLRRQKEAMAGEGGLLREMTGDSDEAAGEASAFLARLRSDLDSFVGQGASVSGVLDGAMSTATGSADFLASSMDGVERAVERVISAYGRMRSAAQDATDGAYEGQVGVIYGNSPGGLTDLNAQLQSAIDNYYVMGAVAEEATEKAHKSMKKYTDALRELDDLIMEESLEGAALQEFRLMQQKAEMIEKFLEDMEGASHHIIEEGLSKIDRLFELRNAKIHQSSSAAKEEVKSLTREFSLSMKLFEQTLTFMHAGIQRTVTLKTPGIASTPFTPQRLSTGQAPTMQIPLSGFAEGVLTKPGEPTVGVFGEKGPEIGGTVEFMKQALVGALQETGSAGGGDIVLDFRGANIADRAAFEKMIKEVAVPNLMTLQRRNYRGMRSQTVRQLKVKA